MIELAAVEVEAADKGEDRAILRSHRYQRRLHLWHLGNLPTPLVIATDANHCATPNASSRGRFVAQRPDGELKTVAVNRNGLTIATNDFNFGGRGFQDDGDHKVVAVRGLLERAIQRVLELVWVARQGHERFRPAITMAPLVIEHAPA